MRSGTSRPMGRLARNPDIMKNWIGDLARAAKAYWVRQRSRSYHTSALVMNFPRSLKVEMLSLILEAQDGFDGRL